MKEVGKTRNSGFDLLRIVAMGGVILIHSTIYLPIPNIVLPFFMWGGAGVQIFFVLSACLAGESFYKYNCETKCYYIKRCKKILPSYYMAILLAMIYQICVQENNLQDIYHLKWIRYFLGLNTILPSNDYDMWNNLYGFWTMSAFIYFYVVVPVIFKLVKSVKQAVFFFAMSFGISLVWKVIINYGFGKITGLEELNVLSGASPFGVLYQFAIGIIVFCVIKQECENIGNIILSIIAIIGLILSRDAFVWCAITGIIIIAIKNNYIILQGNIKKIVSFISRHSFNIYLCHLLAFDIAWNICEHCLNENSLIYIAWSISSIILIMIFCMILLSVEKLVGKLCVSS